MEVRYRPVVDPDDPDADPDRDEIEAIGDAVAELQREGPGDVLVFLPGEREIRDTADALAKRELPRTPRSSRSTPGSRPPSSTASSPRIPGRRIVLATNVAETSLTVPGIRYVVDTGLARISRYSRRLKVQRLPIEKVARPARTSAPGRCGRVADGICIRLYAEDDFDARPEFTDPEILRTNLASVILQMIALDLGDLAAFPFVDKPDLRAVGDGLALLNELGALEHGQRTLTAVGRALSTLPVDPRLGRMLVEADRTGCLREVLVITAALSVQDPRERPAEQRQAADAKHARFDQPTARTSSRSSSSGSTSQEQRDALTGNRFRKLLREEFLHFLRIREWQDLHGQLRQAARNAGMTLERRPGATPDRIHVAVLSGLLSQVGLREARDPRVPRRPRRQVHDLPGLAAGEEAPALGDGRRAGGDLPAVGPHRREDPAGVGRAARRAPGQAHVLRAALVAQARRGRRDRAGDAARRPDRGRPHRRPRPDRPGAGPRAVPAARPGGGRLGHPPRLLRREPRAARRRRGAGDPGAAARPRRSTRTRSSPSTTRGCPPRSSPGGTSTPGGSASAAGTRTSSTSPREFLTTAAGRRDPTASAYPDAVEAGGLTLPLSYAFEPGKETDGITVDVPVAALHQVDPTPFTWQVPGLREELVTALIKTLPKQLRRLFAPAPDHARAVLARLQAGRSEPLLDGLERELGRMRNVTIPRDAWELDRLPEHLTVTFRVVDERGREVARGTDLEKLRARAGAEGPRGTGDRRCGHRGDRARPPGRSATLPREIGVRRGPHVVTGYPGLVDRGDVGGRAGLPDGGRARPGAPARRPAAPAAGDPVARPHGASRNLDNAARLGPVAHPARLARHAARRLRDGRRSTR